MGYNKNMKKNVIFLIIILLVLVGGGLWFYSKDLNISPVITGSTFTISMEKDKFVPNSLVIKKGDTVVFKNNDTDLHWPASDFHPTHGIYPEFDPLRGVSAGAGWSFTFDKKGPWRFHDHLVPAMRGTITVE